MFQLGSVEVLFLNRVFIGFLQLREVRGFRGFREPLVEAFVTQSDFASWDYRVYGLGLGL